jgi:hypothetical protein
MCITWHSTWVQHWNAEPGNQVSKMIGAHCQVYKFTHAHSQDCRCTLLKLHVQIAKFTSTHCQVQKCTLPKLHVHNAKFTNAHWQVHKYTLPSLHPHIDKFASFPSLQVYKCTLPSFSTMQVHIARLYKFTNAPSMCFSLFLRWPRLT